MADTEKPDRGVTRPVIAVYGDHKTGYVLESNAATDQQLHDAACKLLVGIALDAFRGRPGSEPRV